MLLHINSTSGYRESLNRSLSRQRERVKSTTVLQVVQPSKQNQEQQQIKLKVKSTRTPPKKPKRTSLCQTYMPELTTYQRILQKYF